MEMLRKKLKSQSGVSIIMAMFLFLICAVIGSLVLTAATTAAGRKALAAQSDQRYYSVDSAARLIRDLVEEGSVTLLRTETQRTEYVDGITRYVETDTSETERISSEEKDAEYSVPVLTHGGNTLADSDLLAFAVKSLIPALNETDSNYGWDWESVGSDSASGALPGKTFSISVPDDVAETDTSFLNAAVNMTVDAEGNLIFRISSGGYALTETFRLVYTSHPNVFKSQRVDSRVQPDDTKTDTDEVKYFTDTYTIKSETTKKGTFQWEFVSSSVE